jgi:RNA polymerase sigma factor (sigma-70 family)
MKFDREFIARLKQKDERAFTELYHQTGTMLYNYILNRVSRHQQTAEDVLSEVFSAAVIYVQSLTPLHNVVGWLFNIAKSKVVDHYRSSKKERRWRSSMPIDALADKNEAGCDPEAQVIKATDRTEVVKLFSGLRPEHQQVLTLRYVEERSQKQIADVLHWTEKTVENTLYRARLALERKVKSLEKRVGTIGGVGT